MVARSVSFRLKPNTVGEFTELVEVDVLPLLREQKGFQDAISLVLPEGLQIVGISLWDSQEDADRFGRTAYPEVLKTLEKVIGGPPEVHIFEVSNSTFHEIAARVTA